MLSRCHAVRVFYVFFHIACLTSEGPRLECWCLDSPQQGTIQNLMYEIRDSVR